MPRVKIVPCAALWRSAGRLKAALQAVSAVRGSEVVRFRRAARSGCRLKPAFQAVSAILMPGRMRSRTGGRFAPTGWTAIAGSRSR